MFNLLEENFTNNIPYMSCQKMCLHVSQIIATQNFVFNFQLIDISEHVLDENAQCRTIQYLIKCTLEED